MSNGEVELIFTSHFKSELHASTSAFVIERVTEKLPYVSLPSDICNDFNDLILADPFFYMSRNIDILFGVNVFLSLIDGNLIKHGLGCPFALSSKLGWIISGKVTFESHEPNRDVVNHACGNTDELVRSFWELENIPSSRLLSNEEWLCEIQFEKNVWRNDHGRYYVALPFKLDRKALGNSRVTGLQRLYSLERRLATMPDIYNQYRQFMQEYLSLGHMELISPNCKDVENQHYYIPHHYIIKESSLTTKLRVVFDGSKKSLSGTSLNDRSKNPGRFD
ncbi:uncharacterized protein [Centruroides vittatus]|uniref:uncharacterized protein n=1 Tax=Centruroides vittatus TaxID=120091 RepID=UPI00350F1746